jgi:hypothetical protein
MRRRRRDPARLADPVDLLAHLVIIRQSRRAVTASVSAVEFVSRGAKISSE